MRFQISDFRFQISDLKSQISVRRGFTLLELLLVISLMGIATSMGMVMFSKITDAWRDTTDITRLDSTARAAFDQIRQDLAETVSAKKAGVAIHGSTQNANDNTYFNMTFPNDRMVIPAEMAPNPSAPRQRVDIEYWVDRTSSGHTFVRTVRVPGQSDASVNEMRLNDNALAFCVEYRGKEPGSPWQREWKKTTEPGAVRVTFTLMDQNRRFRQIVRKAVFPIEVD